MPANASAAAFLPEEYRDVPVTRKSPGVMRTEEWCPEGAGQFRRVREELSIQG
jgi:hypothetical protein